VAAANIATALAKQGKGVLIIDMDIEAPGLQNVFEVTETDKYRKKRGIQDYLKLHISLEELNDLAVFDLTNGFDTPSAFSFPHGGSLRFLAASTRTTNVLSELSELPERMEVLVDYFAERYNLDYIIIDAASGIREAFTLALNVTNVLLVFFRWTRQHLEGTIKIGTLLEVMNEMGGTPNLQSFKLIASIVPNEEELRVLKNKELANALLQIKKESKVLLEEELDEAGELFYEIPEVLELKWRERILVASKGNTPYDVIAKSLMEEQ